MKHSRKFLIIILMCAFHYPLSASFALFNVVGGAMTMEEVKEQQKRTKIQLQSSQESDVTSDLLDSLRKESEEESSELSAVSPDFTPELELLESK
jgi:hypothetical protein